MSWFCIAAEELLVVQLAEGTQGFEFIAGEVGVFEQQIGR